MTKNAKPKQKTDQRFGPPRWRDIVNWGLASAGAATGWFVVLNHLFEEWNWYDALDDFSPFVLGLFICGTLGLAVGAAQAFALPRVVAAFRRRWFWQTALTLGGGFFMVYAVDEITNIDALQLNSNPDEVSLSVFLTLLAIPLLWSQSRLLRAMGGALTWLWPIPNLLFLWIALAPDMGERGITLALLVWGFACGGVIYLTLAEVDSPPEKGKSA